MNWQKRFTFTTLKTFRYSDQRAMSYTKIVSSKMFLSGALILGLFSNLVFLVSCTRPNLSRSVKIVIKAPSTGDATKPITRTLSANQKWCFGVEVFSSDAPRRGGSACKPDLGQRVGFVDENVDMSLNVSKGSQRHFQLYSFIAGSSETCPSFDESFFINTTNLKKLYRLQETVVDLKNETEQIVFEFSEPNLASDIATTLNLSLSCSSVSQLRGVAYSDGSVMTPAGLPFLTPDTLSSPLVDGVVKDFGVVSSSNWFKYSTQEFLVPANVASVSVKPDTEKIYGILNDGTIVEVASMTGTISEPAVCPFSVTNCRVPLWMQAISAGYGTSLYGLDHSGKVYSLEGSLANETGVAVSPRARQVVYY